MFEAIVALARKWRPPEGWLLWWTALAILLLVPAAAETAGWVPYLGPALAVIVFFGYWASFGLTRPRVRAEAKGGVTGTGAGLPGWAAALVLAVLGLLTVSLVVGLREAPVPDGAPWLLRLPARVGLAEVEMAERLIVWAKDVRAGAAGQDDAVFRWVLGLAVWAAAAWAGWWLYAHHKPLAALLPAAVLLATNAYYYWNGRFWVPFFFGLLAVVAILTNRHGLERRWQRLGMDYSEDVRTDILLATLGLSLLVAAGAFVMPRVVVRPTAEWFDELTAAPLDKLGETGRQLFPGLRRVSRPLLAEGGALGGMPRAYLLGSGEELSQEVVMRVSTDELAALAPGERPSADMGHYWRAVTYDTYDGRGWRNGAAVQEEFSAGEPWFESTLAWRRPVRQRIELEHGGNRAFFAAGEPVAVNRPYNTLVRTPSGEPPDDLVALTGSGRRYEIVSLAPAADEQALRSAGTEYPPSVVDRYVYLPPIPARVRALARSIAAGAETPYDQALALEAGLRRYPYDLAVAPAPDGRDAVDYFLFDAKTGYCDYYASAMVVMARSLGIPARLATGYATGEYDPEARAFVVHGDDAHTWPELYFPGIGWVPFEPTGSRLALPVAEGSQARPEFGSGGAAQLQSELASFRDQRVAQQRVGWIVVLVSLALAAVAVAVVWLRRPEPSLEETYGGLTRWGRRLGRPPGEGETASEYGRGLSGQVLAVDPARGAAAAGGIREYVDRFEAARYSADPEPAAQEARRRWPQLVRELRSVWLRRLAGRTKSSVGE